MRRKIKINMDINGRIINVKEKKGLFGGLKGLKLILLDDRNFQLELQMGSDVARDVARYFPDRQSKGKGGQPRVDLLADNFNNRKVSMILNIGEKIK